jgi:ubiquinone/menaquinone biosynthesis C-methylase UbiE
VSALLQNSVYGSPAGMQRLEAQVKLSWNLELELLIGAGLRDGMTIVDLGCGPGLVAESLLDHFPSARVIAIEADAEMLAIASSRLARHAGSRLELRHGSAEAPGLQENDADFVLARYLFQHLAEPGTVAAESLRILRLGGTCAVIDVDAQLLGIVTPAMPVVQSIFERGRRHQAGTGGRPLVGRHLWRILRDAGFDHPRLQAFTYHSDELGKEAFLPLLSVDQLQAAKAAGHISQPEMAIATASVQHFLNDPNGFVLMLGLLATGRKGSPR